MASVSDGRFVLSASVCDFDDLGVEDEKMTELEQTKYCEKCESMKPMYFSKNFVIMGCMHKPYKGKWVAEIDKCPRKETVDTKED